VPSLILHDQVESRHLVPDGQDVPSTNILLAWQRLVFSLSFDGTQPVRMYLDIRNRSMVLLVEVEGLYSL